NADFAPALTEFVTGLLAAGPLPALIATVNPPVADEVARVLREAGVEGVERFGSAGGRDREQGGPGDGRLPVPIEDALEDRSTVGQDRLLAALGAWWRTKQACIVIDAGTAVTVDFVDGTGVFQGGAIAPGVGMM